MSKSTEFLSVQPPSGEPSGGLAIASSRQSAEVQSAIVVAKRFPRDEIAALGNIKRACERPRLAKDATYAFKRGSGLVEGPSIRLAEAIAQAWGNVSFGFTELERKSGPICGESLVEAQAWDLQNNVRRNMTFTVRHWRDTQQGGYALKDERDIYELCANQASRRVRACILAIIPGDIVDEALEVVERTISKDEGGKPLADRVRDMVIAFNTLGVTQEMIEGRLQHPIGATLEAELGQLRKIYTSIKDGIGKRDEFFSPHAKPVKETGAVIEAETAAQPAEIRLQFMDNLKEAGITVKKAMEVMVSLHLAEKSHRSLEQVSDASIGKVMGNWDEFVEAAK